MLNFESLLYGLIKHFPPPLVSSPLHPKVKVALIGAGSCGLPYLSVFGAHPDIEVGGVWDRATSTIEMLQKNTIFPCYSDFMHMLDVAKPDAVIVTVPLKDRYEIIKELLIRKIPVFAESPLCQETGQAEELAWLSTAGNIVNQYCNPLKFSGTFRELRKILLEGYLGDIDHFTCELFVKKREDKWDMINRQIKESQVEEAACALDLIQDMLGPVVEAEGNIIKPLYSSYDDSWDVLLKLKENIAGILSVKYRSDEFQNPSLSLEMTGSKGQAMCDEKNMRVFFDDDNPYQYYRGWNEKTSAELSSPVSFFFNSPEFTAQLDYFVKAVKGIVPNNINTFEDAWQAAKALDIIKFAVIYASFGKNVVWR